MNQRLGWMFESVGDINDDGYMDTMIGSSSGFTPSGLLELYLGSSNGLQTLPEVIQEMLLTKTSERQGRVIDHDSAGSMEKKKMEGYF
mgnify:CR=1 FL=1